MTKDEKEKLAADIYNAAFADAAIYGAGYTKISTEGISHISRDEIMRISDEDRESLINAAYDQMTQATSKSAQDQHWRDMCYHVRLRSPEQVLKMETERRIGAAFAPLFTYEANHG